MNRLNRYSVIICALLYTALFTGCSGGDVSSVKPAEKAEIEKPPVKTAQVPVSEVNPAAEQAEKNPASVKTVQKKKQAPAYSWAKPQAKVIPAGKLDWAPHAFTFETGESVRYIDYENGNDADNGTSKDVPWKHHPWDPNAAGQAKECKGIHSYVFKRGVVYRGRLVVQESGTKDNPIRLTSDPAWGEGEAVIAGSESLIGWKQGADNPDIPEGGKVWYTDVDWPVRNVWMVENENVTRVNLARTPNWKVSDPEDVLSEWWQWENPQWWKEPNRTTTVGKKKMHLGIDTKHLTENPEYYKGAIVWSEWAIVMGTPFPAPIEAFYPEKNAIAFQGRWFGTSGQINTGNRYCLEDKPHYLDSPGEFWFDKKGSGGRLYIRLPEDKDPNTVTVEAGKYYNLIEDECSDTSPQRMDIYRGDKNELDSKGLEQAVISGLSFRFTNTWWNLEYPPWMHKEVNNAAIRLLGSSDDVTVKNCVFEHVKCAIRVDPLTGNCKKGMHVFSDNRIEYIDGSSIVFRDNGSGMDVKVLRNKIFMSGMRPYRQSDGHSLCVNFPDTMEIAGNILDRTYGSGIFVFGGKGGGSTSDKPLSRNLIYGNQATNTLLTANDWGGIETWQGGPFYVFNNISGNPNGYWNWSWQNGHRPGSARLGFAFYLDGGFKNYHFNNIAWGISNDLSSPHCNNTAFYHAVTTTNNEFFNNTAYNFAQGSAWSPAGGRQLNLGNVFTHISKCVFQHGKQKEDKDAVYKKYPFESIGYAKNVFYDITGKFGNLEGAGSNEYSFEAFKTTAQKVGLLASDIGVMAGKPVLADAAEHDFRPAPGSAAVDSGVKVFVPWSLYAMVGEWNFCRNNADPTVLLDDHWYMRPYFTNRKTYKDMPVNNLKGVGITLDSYVRGELEDWTDGALTLNGDGQYCVIKDADFVKEMKYTVGRRKNKKEVTATGEQISTPDAGTGNFLIEIYFRTDKGHSDSVLVSKMGEQGYVLGIEKDGSVYLSVSVPGSESCIRKSSVPVNDGIWHHVVAELDRKSPECITMYIDGVKLNGALTGSMPGEGVTLSNTGDFYLGRGNDGNYFAGAIDFLRIARGTLADAKTTIDELYQWEFNGPFLRDFAGNEPVGKRDAGALEQVN